MVNRKLIENYIDGWKTENVEQITNCLSAECVIIESHGPTYSGLSEIKEWAKQWLSSGNKVLEWDILSFYELDETIFFEWKFKCIARGEEHILEGMSIVKVENGKINYIREYRTTKPRFDWKKS